MSVIVSDSIEFGGLQLSLESGRIACQADGSVLVRYGETSVLVTVVSSAFAKDSAFFPLSVQFVAKSYATGKIPGGFIKREGKLSDREVLISRLIDRTIRPMFPAGFFNEVAIVCSLIGYDPSCVPEVPALIGAVVACMLAKLPLCDVVAGIKIGLSDSGEPIIDLKHDPLNEKLNLFVSASKEDIYMLEVGANQVDRECLLGAIGFGVKSLASLLEFMLSFVESNGKAFVPSVSEVVANSHESFESYKAEFSEAYLLKSKFERSKALSSVRNKVKQELLEEYKEESLLRVALEDFEKSIIRKSIIESGIRVGGRSVDEIRDISIDYDLLPKTHGSALFTRGDTQSLVITTLGVVQDSQIVDDWDGNRKESFLLHYNFPPYAVGECSMLRPPSRREIGHGRLAWKALCPVIPAQSAFPYAIRIVSEITSSDGSSSMATVCGTSLSLMDAGVPIESAVSGIAMGCIFENDKIIILSDICGEEDFAGDMDFKVAGTANGITALQMDIKAQGIPVDSFGEFLSKAEEGRAKILQKMNEALSVHKDSVKCGVPCISSFLIGKDKIRLVIGTGGRTIRDICDKSGAKIEVDQSGSITISAPDGKSIEKAKSMIVALTSNVEVGSICDGVVSRVTNFGIFIDLINGKKGLAHISELSEERIESASDVFSIGDPLKVVVLGEDKEGRLRLSVKQAVARGIVSYGKTTPEDGAVSSDVSKNQSTNNGDELFSGNDTNKNTEENIASKKKHTRTTATHISRKHSGIVSKATAPIDSAPSKLRNSSDDVKPVRKKVVKNSEPSVAKKDLAGSKNSYDSSSDDSSDNSSGNSSTTSDENGFSSRFF